MNTFLNLLVLPTIFAASTFPSCKNTPLDSTWPSVAEWRSLNSSLAGALIKASPAASSCYAGNPFNSTIPCDLVAANWTLTEFHAALPESVDSPLYANDSCLPPGAQGYSEQRGCSIGGLPQYIVNATTEEQIVTAVTWAVERNIRIVVKGTGHDLNGRSSGAYSLSIWTHNFQGIHFDSQWPIPGSNRTADVVIAGSGNNWLRMYTAAEAAGKAVVGGGANTVGLGGFIQGGGHGPLSSHYGLAADQIHQARVVTTTGQILIANAVQNQDLLWAIRGGGAGQYGIVTEYVLNTYSAPSSTVLGELSVVTNGTDDSSVAAAWKALAAAVTGLPDLMDAGLAGLMSVIGGARTGGPLTFSNSLFGYNMTATDMESIVAPIMAKIKAEAGNDSSISISFPTPTEYPNFTSMFHALNPPSTHGPAGLGSMMSSRLLGRDHLSNLPQETLISYLQRAIQSQAGGDGYMIFGMQGGNGPANVPLEMRGALHSSWRTAYLHAITMGASIDATADPQTALDSAAMWTEETKESLWTEWAPEMGSYMNEANPFNKGFKKDYYGDSYEGLKVVKEKYDPSESLFVLSGVGSDGWEYNLRAGKLCRVG